jgi:hypothetical protein
LVDRVTSTNKATLIGRVVRNYLDGECDLRTFLRTAEMIDTALTEDLQLLIEDELDDDACRRLIAVGLMIDRSSALLSEG